MKIKNILCIFIVLFMMALVGCAANDAEPAEKVGNVTLLVTKDFGSEILFKKEVEIQKGWTVLDILKANLEVDIKSGEFIEGINGLKTENGGSAGKRLDWFYYINGICSDVGAGSYELSPDEVIWWDYHAWKAMGNTNSAVIGSFPEPFIHGYRGEVGITTIMAATSKMNLAKDLQNALNSYGISLEIQKLDNDLIEDRTGPTIILGEWQELKEITYLKKLNDAYKKTGTNVHFTDDSLEILDYLGNTIQNIKKGVGVIVAVGEGLGDNSPLWLVAGIDQEGLQYALDVLMKNPDKIKEAYGVAVLSGEVIRLPAQ